MADEYVTLSDVKLAISRLQRLVDLCRKYPLLMLEVDPTAQTVYERRLLQLKTLLAAVRLHGEASRLSLSSVEGEAREALQRILCAKAADEAIAEANRQAVRRVDQRAS